jgi:transcriptional regulator with XRE-family HTH domain
MDFAMDGKMGGRIRDARGKHTQAEIAEACRVEPASISMWESGKSTPTFENLVSLSTALRVRIDWLVFGRLPRDIDGTCDFRMLERVIEDIATVGEKRQGTISPRTFAKVSVAYYRHVSAQGEATATLSAMIDLAEGECETRE